MTAKPPNHNTSKPQCTFCARIRSTRFSFFFFGFLWKAAGWEPFGRGHNYNFQSITIKNSGRVASAGPGWLWLPSQSRDLYNNKPRPLTFQFGKSEPLSWILHRQQTQKERATEGNEEREQRLRLAFFQLLKLVQSAAWHVKPVLFAQFSQQERPHNRAHHSPTCPGHTSAGAHKEKHLAC